MQLGCFCICTYTTWLKQILRELNHGLPLPALVVSHKQLLGHETHELFRLRAILLIRSYPGALVFTTAQKTLAALHLKLYEALPGLGNSTAENACTISFSELVNWLIADIAVWGRFLLIIFVSFAFVVRLFFLAAPCRLRLLSFKYDCVSS